MYNIAVVHALRKLRQWSLIVKQLYMAPDSIVFINNAKFQSWICRIQISQHIADASSTGLHRGFAGGVRTQWARYVHDYGQL